MNFLRWTQQKPPERRALLPQVHGEEVGAHLHPGLGSLQETLLEPPQTPPSPGHLARSWARVFSSVFQLCLRKDRRVVVDFRGDTTPLSVITHTNWLWTPPWCQTLTSCVPLSHSLNAYSLRSLGQNAGMGAPNLAGFFISRLGGDEMRFVRCPGLVGPPRGGLVSSGSC